MDILAIIWLFFVIAALQPILHQRILEASRKRLIARIERKRGSRVILLVHRQETMGLLGFPLMRYISIEDSEAVLRAIRMTDKDVPIDLVLHTPGGLALAAEQIALALSQRAAKVTVFVPFYAMSGGTLIALAAHEIVMDRNAVLGPVDPQIGQNPAVSVLTVLERKPIEKVDDETVIMADMANKALRQTKAALLELLQGRMAKEKAEPIATALSSGIWTHDYPITVREAVELGLTVSTEMPREIYQMMALYPQTAQRRPSVEYIPTVHSRDPERRRHPDRA